MADLADQHRDESSPVAMAAQQLDNRLMPNIDTDSPSKWKLILKIVLVILVLSLVGYFAFTKMKSGPVVVKIEAPKIKTFTIKDIYPELTSKLASSTGEATTSKAFVLISITDFTKAYEVLTQNEESIANMAKDYFGIDEISAFTIQPINNNDLHVADAGDRLVVYGYLNQKYFIMTSSISDWLQISEKLSGK